MIKSYNIRAYDINTGKYLFLTYSYTPPMFGISRFGGNKYDVHKINYKFEEEDEYNIYVDIFVEEIRNRGLKAV